MKGLVGVLLGAALAVAVACGGSQKAATMPPVPPTQSDAGMLPSSNLHDQIDELDRKITAEMAGANLPRAPEVTPSTAHIPSAPVPMAEAPSIDPTCHPGRSEACTDACRLGDSICKNATKICDLAAQLPGDAWAAQKCESGKQSCATAHERCCTCS